jgi:chromosome partitioning protein
MKIREDMIYTIPEIARLNIKGLSEPTLRRAVAEGRIKTEQISPGKIHRIRGSELFRFIGVVPQDFNSRPPAKVVAITNRKGGVGKTTTTMNLGTALARLGRKVLLIDMDGQSNLSNAMLGEDISYYPLTMFNVLLDRDQDNTLKPPGSVKISDIITKTKTENLWIAPANLQLVKAEDLLYGVDVREFVLKNKLKEIIYDYDYILIDSPPGGGIMPKNVLYASTDIFLIVEATYFGIQGAEQVDEVVKEVKLKGNEKLTISLVIITKYEHTVLAREVKNEVEKYFRTPDGRSLVAKTVIPRNVRVAEAPSFHQSAIDYDPASSGAKAYMALAKEVIEFEQGNREAAGAGQESREVVRLEQ